MDINCRGCAFSQVVVELRCIFPHTGGARV